MSTFDYREADPGKDEAKKISPPAPIENTRIDITPMLKNNNQETKEARNESI